MKSEREIRKYRDDLKKCLQKPCGCKTNGHAYECEQGRFMMIAAIGELSWVLGEAPQHDRMVEHMAKSAREV